MTPEQRASQTLFGDVDFDHQGADGPYCLPGGGKVTYSALVKRYRTEDDAPLTVPVLTGEELTSLLNQKLGRDKGNRALAFGLLEHFDVTLRS